MVTLVYVLFVVLLMSLYAGIDTFLYKLGILKSIYTLFYLNIGTGKMIVMMQLTAGLAFSVFIDYRDWKKQQQQRSGQEGEKGLSDENAG